MQEEHLEEHVVGEGKMLGASHLFAQQVVGDGGEGGGGGGAGGGNFGIGWRGGEGAKGKRQR